MWKASNNNVTIIPDRDFDTAGELLLDTSQDMYRHVAISGTVVSVPTLTYHGEDINRIRRKGILRSKKDKDRLTKLIMGSTLYDVPMEVSVGDKVYFGSLTISESPLEGGYASIPYDSLIARVNGNGIYPLNGHVLISPIMVGNVFGSIESDRLGIVRHIGCRVRSYRDFPTHNDAINGEIKEGDTVLFMGTYNKPLEYELHRKLPERLFYMQRRNILAIKG